MRKQKGLMLFEVIMTLIAVFGLFSYIVYMVSFESYGNEIEYLDSQETLDLAVRFDSFGVRSIINEGEQKVIITTSGDKFTVNWDEGIENVTSFELRTMPGGNQVLCAYQKCAEVL